MKFSTRFIIILVHAPIIAAFFLYISFQAYPDEAGGAYLRQRTLIRLYEAAKQIETNTSELPTTLDAFLKLDAEKYWIVNDDHLTPWYAREDLLDLLEYRIIDGEPVITDLGLDKKIGGLDYNMDFTYPVKFQKPLKMVDFIKSKSFASSIAVGSIFAILTSLCLYGIWRKWLPPRPVSAKDWIKVLGTTTLFVILELGLANTILFAHIYPHH